MLFAGIFVVMLTGSVFAQATDPTRVARYRDELDQIRRLEGQIPEGRAFTFDFGGWYRGSYTKFDDFMQDREVSDHDVRLWGTFSLGTIHQFYARVRMTYVRWADGDDPDGGDDHDFVGPNLEQGWWDFNVTQAAEKYFNQQWPVDLRIRAGRQYYEIGYGFVLANILDGVTVEIDHRYFNVQLFAAETFPSIENLDVTAPEFWHDDRSFVGVRASMKNVIPRHEPYVYWMIVNDRNSYNGGTPGQRYGYDPEYLGVGSRGELLPRLRYWAEYVFESGRTASAGAWPRDDIDANALVAGLEFYLGDCPMRPRLEVEYGWGSGDPDSVAPHTAAFGNLPGTDHEGFLGYGYHDTGVAFAARLSNLRSIRATFSLRPLEAWESTKRLELGASYYWFRKDRTAGGITDFQANLPSKDLGEELDLFLNWRVTSDVLWTVRWGVFNPGGAYTNRSDRDYLLTSLTYSF
jgi:hypothetical protein